MSNHHGISRLLLPRLLIVGALFASISIMGGVSGVRAQSSAPLPSEAVPNVATLPQKIPQSWVFAHDASFFSLTTGKIMLIDTLSESRNVRGMIGAAQMAGFQQSKKRDELYIAETFLSRGTRGDETDVISIYDTKTLKFKKEIILPGKKRLQIVTQKAAFQLTRNEKFALVFNFTPASSVTVVDMVRREVVNEIDVAGCMLIYPMGKNGFATLCGDGALLAVNLNRYGQVKSQKRSRKFNDISDNPLFMKTAWHKGVAYFTSFKGNIQAIDLSKDKFKVLRSWKIPSNHRNALPNARPSGWQIITADARGNLYVVMRANAGNGDHKFGGAAIYVLDPSAKKLIDVLALDVDAFSIQATNSKSRPTLAVTNINMELDIFDLKTNAKLRTVGGWGPAMPLALHGAK